MSFHAFAETSVALLKSIVVLMPVFVALQGVSLLLRSASRLRSQ